MYFDFVKNVPHTVPLVFSIAWVERNWKNALFCSLCNPRVFQVSIFCALSLSHVISSCTWHSLQHVWQFHFQTGSTSKRKELPIQFVNHQEKSHFWSKLSFIPMRHFQGFLNTVYVSTPLFTETETPADAFINGKMHLVASRAEKNKKPLLIFRWEKIKLDQSLIIA